MPDFPAAPFYSAEDLTGRPGDAALGGVQQNFDPSVKNPSEFLQSTLSRLDAQSAQAIEAQKQRAFQAQQQAERQRNDILMRHMDYDHEDKRLKAQQDLQARQHLYDMFNRTGGTISTLKDEVGNDMPLQYLPDDQQELNKSTEDYMKWALEDPAKNIYSPDRVSKEGELKQKRINASMRSVYYRQAAQQLQNTFDPEERDRLTKYMSQIQSSPLTQMPTPYLQRPTVRPLIDVQKDYKDGKGYESFEEGEGVPNSRYLGLASATDPATIDEGFKRLQFFKGQPEGQSAEAYASWKKNLDNITAKRGLPTIDLGAVVTPDGKVVFDDNTYAKQQALARKMLVASELMNSGHLKSPDEEDELKTKKTKAEISEVEARTQKIKAEMERAEKGKPQKPLSPTETAELESARSTVARVKNVFDPGRYPGFGRHLEHEQDGKKVYNTIEKVDVAEALQKKGYDPADWGVFQAPSEFVKDLSGHERVSKSSTGVEKRTGETEPSDKIFALKNNKTGDVQMAYFKKADKGDKYSLQTMVSAREAVGNAAKHKHQYKTENAKLSDEITRNEAEFDKHADVAPSTKAKANDEEVIRARLVPITIKKKDGTMIKAMKDPVTGKRYAL